MKQVIITTDGSCEPNPGPGGWAAILRHGAAVKEISGGSPATTNNRMEMRAIVEGLRALKGDCEVTIRTDSKNAMSWCKGLQFAKQSHREKFPEAYAMHLKFQELAKKHKITFEWVKGHAGDPDNERADYLAEMAYRKAGSQPPAVAASPSVALHTAAPTPAPVVMATPAEPTQTPAPASPSMIRLTQENLHALSGSPALNGFTKKQIELLGFPYPAPKGWLKSLIGSEIPIARYEEAKKAIASKWKQRKEQNQMKL